MAYRQRSDKYWDKRAQEQLSYVERQALPHLREIDKAYATALKLNLDEVRRLYEAYYRKQGWDTAALKQLAAPTDIRRFQQAVAAAGLETDLPDGYKFRLNRLELVEANLWLEIKKAGLIDASIQTEAHRRTMETAYQYAIYNLTKATGVPPAFSTLPTDTIDKVLNAKFYGRNYSQRVWRNTDRLAKNLKTDLAAAIATGQSHSKTARTLRDRYGVTRYEAVRLVQTETAHFNTEASMLSYENIGLDEWVYVATLDSRTDDQCAMHDGQRYRVGSGPKPPLHAFCRCAARPYVADEYEPDERIMRDPVTGQNRTIANMSFEQWRQLYL